MAGAFGDWSVLVIEDESFTRMVLAKMLGTLGFKAVHQAADGEAGLAAVRAHAPDVVVCDVEMQPMDGLGFLKALRASPDSRDRALPVVFMTNRTDQARMDEAAALGAGIFILKPATPESLAECLSAKLG
ncbi:response regulator [Azospirillum rugosum]|uniref:Two-component system chemotaxis response regulator CheY n=1 Tax=Azospirillum rugosum TaxID=416170 RepID=A0ABS4SS79_9PROT|nr:response regulator [Azospirillum rugosum]MBP2295408.1 two-component system chemotaxis response regulator CheY [Azospirillum rugosum]MDQ0528783.1 two-component system chemotaxis response regulator CheY [Azospirillum rugosum]